MVGHIPMEEVKNKIRNTLRRGKFIYCIVCGKERFVSPSNFIRGNPRYCSKKCNGLNFRGTNNPLWKGGVSRAFKTGYYSVQYKQWRMKVFKRDNFTCQECGLKNIYVTAHHIKSFADYPKFRFDLNNGITLCENCHSRTDNYKGKNLKGKKHYVCNNFD
jgi:5-methylcytosine-specific restriction endonuclease McrA